MNPDQTDPYGAILSGYFAIFDSDEVNVSNWWENG